VVAAPIDVLFLDYPKWLDLIFLYLPGLMISTGNDQIVLQSDFGALLVLASVKA
jgi:hypothetical protein